MTKTQAHFRQLRRAHLARERSGANEARRNQALALEMSSRLPPIEAAGRQARIIAACINLLTHPETVFGGQTITVDAGLLSRLCEACMCDRPQHCTVEPSVAQTRSETWTSVNYKRLRAG